MRVTMTENEAAYQSALRKTMEKNAALRQRLERLRPLLPAAKALSKALERSSSMDMDGMQALLNLKAALLLAEMEV